MSGEPAKVLEIGDEEEEEEKRRALEALRSEEADEEAVFIYMATITHS